MGGPDDTHPGSAVVFHAHADTYGNSSNDPHDEYNSKHDAGNRCAREDIPNIGIVGAAVGRVPIAAVSSAVFTTLSEAVVCVDKEQDQLRKQDPWTPGQPARVHTSRWPEFARQDRQTDGLERRLGATGKPGTGRR